MTTTTTPLMEMLTYRAPYLIEKLLKERIVETSDEADLLFTEVLRYLVLDRLYPEKRWQMYSRRIDEVWHQFVLFTAEYLAFCTRYLGGFMHHYPSNAPGIPPKASGPGRRTRELDAFFDFREHYERTFGAPLPSVWHDRTSVTLHRRVILDVAVGPLELVAGDGTVTLRAVEKGEVFTVSELATPALAFILRTPAFYVRELPGELADDEKLGLVETLLAMRVLLLAP